jgi:hypothetical protein
MSGMMAVVPVPPPADCGQEVLDEDDGAAATGGLATSVGEDVCVGVLPVLIRVIAPVITILSAEITPRVALVSVEEYPQVFVYQYFSLPW